MLLADLVSTSARVRHTRSRKEKLAALAACLRAADHSEVATVASYLAGEVRQERLDVGWRTVRDLSPAPADEPTLSVADVHAALERVARAGGAGSRAAKSGELGALLAAATAEEQLFLTGLILGELRQGALAGMVAQAVALAWEIPEATVRRAWMLSGDLWGTAHMAATQGVGGLAEVRLTVFCPIEPMLAATAATAAEAVESMGSALVDHKLDGARIQVHRAGDEVRVYTRNLRDVTARLPEVIAATRALEVEQIVLDGEVLAVRTDGMPHPFQDTMARFGSDVDEAAPPGVALVPFFFDCLRIDGVDLLDEPLQRRRAELQRVVPAEHLVPGSVVDDADAAQAVFDAALVAGQEGVVVKDLSAPYEAGRRGASWRKVKPTHTLDLVVLAVEWGSGRRHGWLSNLHLGARADDGSGFVMLGKTFKGMTDELLAWQTTRLLELETSRERHVVHVRPELVVEIAFDGVQTSSRYPGGVALRFARVKRYREDKSAAQADTLSTVRSVGGLATSG